MQVYIKHLKVIGLQFFKNCLSLFSFGIQVIVPSLTFRGNDLDINAWFKALTTK